MATSGVAWLITWEGTNPPERVAAILHYRINDKCVSAIVELLYALQGASVEELAAYALKPTSNPYRVVNYGSGFICGHNPWLYARRVDKLKLQTAAGTGVQTISWIERPVYRLAKSRKSGAPLVKKVAPARANQIQRTAAKRLWRVGA